MVEIWVWDFAIFFIYGVAYVISCVVVCALAKKEAEAGAANGDTFRKEIEGRVRDFGRGFIDGYVCGVREVGHLAEEAGEIFEDDSLFVG